MEKKIEKFKSVKKFNQLHYDINKRSISNIVKIKRKNKVEKRRVTYLNHFISNYLAQRNIKVIRSYVYVYLLTSYTIS